MPDRPAAVKALTRTVDAGVDEDATYLVLLRRICGQFRTKIDRHTVFPFHLLIEYIRKRRARMMERAGVDYSSSVFRVV